MNRRHAMAGLAGMASAAAWTSGPVWADEKAVSPPGAIKLALGKQIDIGMRSSPLKVGDAEVHVLSLDGATFQLDEKSRLTATLNAVVIQHAALEYWISSAVYDGAGRLLGVASHKEQVRLRQLGRIVTAMVKIPLDFGVSLAFKNAEFLVVAISEPDVAAE